ncbi:ROK family protein [Deinococcus peraridilitoris]|nr:ROK family protein [Deinococcus peraridilitoris]
MDVGGTHLRFALGDLTGQLTSRHRESIDQHNPVRQILRTVQHAERNLGQSLQHVVIGVAGVVQGDQLYDAPNLTALQTSGALGQLRNALPCPVTFINDANLAALGENLPDLAFIALGTGLGCGFVRGGKIMSGSRGRAGELGLLPYASEVGSTLEEVLSGPGIERLYALYGGSGDAHLALADPGEAALRTREVITDALSFLLSTIALSFDPEHLIFGGGVGLRCGPLLHSAWADACVRGIEMPIPRLTQLGDDAALRGGLHLASRLAQANKDTHDHQ